MITSNLVPCGKDSIYRMLRDKKNGKVILDTDWSGRGKPRIGDNSTMAEWKSNPGHRLEWTWET
jgi:hypothetical protein